MTELIGVFGGTFDPIHFGHLRLAEETGAALGLDRVCFVPAGQPPHRAQPGVTAAHRLEMVRRAVASNPFFEADAREVQRDAPSFTVDTLAALRAEHSAATRLWLMLGADAFHGLPTWHAWTQVLELANLAVVTRPGSADPAADLAPGLLREAVAARRVPRPEQAGASGSIWFHPMTPLAISATDIRAALGRRGSVRYLLPDAVLDYINEHQLYRSS